MARRPESGFTLIELLVVIVILGVLAAVVVFAVGGIDDRGERAAVQTDAQTIRTAQEAHCAKFGHYAPDFETLVTARFLADVPEYNQMITTDGPCGDGGPGTPSGFTVFCDVDFAAGCGEGGGAIAVGGTLVVANGTGSPSPELNPAVTSEGGIHSNSEDMFNGLLRYETDGSIGGDLAQNFDFNNAVPASANPNCASAPCDPVTTVATFVLREGVKFHNGDILDPEDVEFSFSKAILAAHGRTRAIIGTLGVTGSGTATVVPPDAITTSPPTPGNGGTVKFNLRQVYAPLRFTLNVTEAPILPESVYGPCFDNGSLFVVGGTCTANRNPVGTGPFKFASLNSEEINTVKNPDYFRVDSSGLRLPYLDAVKKLRVTGSVLAALQSGAVDVGPLAGAELATAQADPSIVKSSTPRGSGGGNCITTIAFNMTKRGTNPRTDSLPATDPQSPYFGQNKPGENTNAPPHKILGDPRVREAIFKSLDRNKFFTDVNFSAGRVADAPLHSIFQPDGAYQGPRALPTFDRTAAGALLDAAGWSGPLDGGGFRTALDHPNENNPDPQLQVPDGTKLALEYLFSGTGESLFSAEVKSQLKTVGIDVTSVFGVNGSFVAPNIFRFRNYDMGQISYCNNDEPQFGVRRQYHTDQLVETDAFTNASGYKSTLMDQLWVDASKAPDVATYQAKFLQIQNMALGLDTPGGPALTALEQNQRIPHVWMLESAGTRGTRANCTGFNNNNTGLYVEAASCSR